MSFLWLYLLNWPWLDWRKKISCRCRVGHGMESSTVCSVSHNVNPNNHLQRNEIAALKMQRTLLFLPSHRNRNLRNTLPCDIKLYTQSNAAASMQIWKSLSRCCFACAVESTAERQSHFPACLTQRRRGREGRGEEWQGEEVRDYTQQDDSNLITTYLCCVSLSFHPFPLLLSGTELTRVGVWAGFAYGAKSLRFLRQGKKQRELPSEGRSQA